MFTSVDKLVCLPKEGVEYEVLYIDRIEGAHTSLEHKTK